MHTIERTLRAPILTLPQVFYFGSKLAMHLFLLERVRIVRRATHRRRWRDWTWTAPVTILGVGFSSLAIVAFRFLWHRLNGDVCSLGFPPVVTVILLVYDFLISAMLTCMFLWLLWSAHRRPFTISAPSATSASSYQSSTSSATPSEMTKSEVLAVTTQSDEESAMGKERPTRAQAPSPGSDRIAKLMRRTLIAAVLMFLPMLINMAVIVAYSGLETDWLCFTVCTLDVTWCSCVASWLTEKKEE